MNRSFTLLNRGLNSAKISDNFRLVISKSAVPFDYVAIDVGSLVGGALRLTKAAAPTEQRRAKEVGRLVSQHLLQILRRVRPTRGLFLTLDGAAPLWMAAASRLSASSTRRVEARLSRLPASPLMHAVEERVVRMLPDNRFGAVELVWSGTGVAGSAEEKITAWALDVAARSGFDCTQHSLALIGGTDMYLNVWALTNYYRVSSLVERNTDLMQLDTTALLEWLGLDEVAAKGDNVTIARARTDTLFLHLLSHGMPSMELGNVTPLHMPALLEQYQRLVLAGSPKASGTADEAASTTPAESRAPCFLFSDVEGNALELNVGHLIRLLGQTPRVSTCQSLCQPHMDDYLEHALQVHAQLCCGHTPDDLFIPRYLQPSVTGTTAGPPPTAHRPSFAAADLLAHLLALVKADSLSSFLNERGAEPCLTLRRARQRKGRAAYWQSTRTHIPPPSSGEPGATATHTCSEDHRQLEASGSDGALVTPASPPSPPAPGPAFWSPAQPLTAAEVTILSQNAPSAVEEALRTFVGVPPHANSGKLIVQAPSVEEAHRRTQTALAFCNADTPHWAVCLGPSYCWTQRRASKLWQMAYIDVGVRGREQEVRRRGNARSDLVLHPQAPRTGPQWYDAASQSWTAVPRFPLPADSPTTPPTQLKLLTWNVMFDRYSGQPTPLGMPGIDWCSPQRYPVLAKVMAREDADMIGMQEVEPGFLEFLKQVPEFRDKYVFSCSAESDVIAPWGVVLLIHRRLAPFVTSMEHVNIPAWSGHVKLMPVASLRLPHGMVSVAAAHLLAPFTKQNVNARTAQDEVLRRYLVKTVPASHDSIVMGDFNDWPTSEFTMPSETRYTECWPQLHPQNPGKTMDETNTFCKLKIEEIFFGRSDKFFVRSQCVKPVEAHLVGTRSVNAENDNTDAPDYLFPSDHYGVSMTFSI